MGLFSKKEETLNQRIKKLRKSKGLTQLELAEKVNVTDKAVSKWETGEGNPEITILIELAKIFEVSLDYLLTGVEKEPEVVVMSKVELCCKDDNVEMFKAINGEALQVKDENGNYFIDYLLKYDCPRVYKAFVNKYGAQRLISSSSFRDEIKFNSDKIMDLLLKYYDIESLEEIKFFENPFSRDQWGSIVNHSGRTTYYSMLRVEMLKKVYQLGTEENPILEKILITHETNKINSTINWQELYLKLLSFAKFDKDEVFINRLIHLFIQINEEAIKELNEKKNTSSSKNNFYKYVLADAKITSSGYDQHYYNYSVVAIPKSIIELYISKGDLDMAQKLNEMNREIGAPTVEESTLNAEKLKKEGTASADDIFIVSCMVNGVVNIDRLIASNNLKLVKYAFENYPISIAEYLNKLVSEKDYKTLFRLSVDHSLNQISRAMILLKKEGVVYLEKCVKETIADIYKKGHSLDVNRSYYVDRIYSYKRKTEAQVKEEVIKELSLKYDKEKLTGNLTKEYFDSLLEANNIELLVIKLCVKLEAILKCDYHLEGTFEEMMSAYTSKYGYEDDGWGYSVESYSSKLLHKMRKYRNGIVHPEQANESLTIDELKSLIDYICKLG